MTSTAPNPIEQVSRREPIGPAGARTAYLLEPRRIHPLIRIAHRLERPIIIGPRILMDHELVLILRGQGAYIDSKGETNFAAGHLLFIEPFSPHEFVSPRQGRHEHVAVHFDWAADFPRFAGGLSSRPAYQVRFPHGLHMPHHLSPPLDARLADAVVNLPRLRWSGEPLAEARASAELLRVLLQLFQVGDDARGGDQRQIVSPAIRLKIQRSIDFAEEHFDRELSAADLAGVAGLSLSHFNRVFRQWTGLSPMDHLRRLRVEKARALLGEVDLSIKQIAARVGFVDVYHFSKVFRRIDGLPPSQYRQSLLASR